jgi:hypothetical protein
MKIVDLPTFRALPENTLFSKYEQCCFGHLSIKGETLPTDFLSQELSDPIAGENSHEIVDTLIRATKTGESIKLDLNSQGRDGLFDRDQLFAVWEPEDVRSLINRLQQCLPPSVPSVP